MIDTKMNCGNCMYWTRATKYCAAHAALCIGFPDKPCGEFRQKMAAKDAEIAKLRDLVKELVGGFENWTEKYPPSEWSQMGQSWQLIEETVARAREMIGGATL